MVLKVFSLVRTCEGVSAGKGWGKIRIMYPYPNSAHGWLLAGVGQTLYHVSCICILHFYVEVGVGPTLHPVFRICIPSVYRFCILHLGPTPYPVSVSRIPYRLYLIENPICTSRLGNQKRVVTAHGETAVTVMKRPRPPRAGEGCPGPGRIRRTAAHSPCACQGRPANRAQTWIRIRNSMKHHSF